ncbi:hypothetical protein [Paenibacillus sp. FSL E2-0177]
MVKEINVNKAALDVVQVLAKHEIPIYMIGQVFQTAFKTVESQKVSPP